MEGWRERKTRLAALGLLLVALGASLWKALGGVEGHAVGSAGSALAAGDGSGQALATGWKGLLLGVPLDANAASREDWDALPGIGPAVSGEIVKTRARLGGLSSEADLLEAKGIGPKKLEAMRRWVRFSPPGV